MGGIEGEGGLVEVESEGGEKFCDTCVLVDSVAWELRGLHMIIYYHCNSDNALLLSFLLTCHPYIPFHFMK